ncbi:hypothetical protein ACWD4L_36555 [Streptomyces sp. NPDC002596]
MTTELSWPASRVVRRWYRSSSPGTCSRKVCRRQPSTDSSGIVALQASTLDLSDSRVTDITPDPSCPDDQASGRGVVFGLPAFIQVDGAAGSSTGFGRVSHVSVARYLEDGIDLNGPAGGTPTQVTVKDNVITGGAQIPTEQFGMYAGGRDDENQQQPERVSGDMPLAALDPLATVVPLCALRRVR